MKRPIMLAAFLFLTGAHYVSAQSSPVRDLNQIRRETSERNRAIEEYDRRNNRNIVLPSSRRLHPSNRIPGSEIRSYVLAAQARTEVNVVQVSSGDTLLVDDGSKQATVRILGIDAPEQGQPFFEEAKKNLRDLIGGKKVVLIYSLHNLRDELGYFPARVFLKDKDAALHLSKNGLAWQNEKDEYFLEKKDDKEIETAEKQARQSKIGIWQSEKPRKPWEYREQKLKERKKAKE